MYRKTDTLIKHDYVNVHIFYGRGVPRKLGLVDRAVDEIAHNKQYESPDEWESSADCDEGCNHKCGDEEIHRHVYAEEEAQEKEGGGADVELFSSLNGHDVLSFRLRRRVHCFV